MRQDVVCKCQFWVSVLPLEVSDLQWLPSSLPRWRLRRLPMHAPSVMSILGRWLPGSGLQLYIPVRSQYEVNFKAMHYIRTFSNVCREHSFHSTSGSHTDSRYHSAQSSKSVRVWDEEWGWGVMGGWVAILTTCTMCPQPHQVASEKMWHSLCGCGWGWRNTYIGVSQYYLRPFLRVDTTGQLQSLSISHTWAYGHSPPT